MKQVYSEGDHSVFAQNFAHPSSGTSVNDDEIKLVECDNKFCAKLD